MVDKLLLILLAIFFILFGIFAVTNLTIAWGPTVLGFSALAAGIICAVRAIKLL